MKIQKFESEGEWLAARNGRITGTRLKDLIVKRGTGRKIGFYELVAERLTITDGYEDMMERGHDLEKEAVQKLSESTGLDFNTDLVIFSRDDHDSIAISPDAFTEDLTTMAEVKCLGSAHHIKTYIENVVPSEYEDQVTQYFIVNDKLDTLYFAMYDPRIPTKQFFYLTIKRGSMQGKIAEYLELERQILGEVDTYVNELSDF